MASCQRFGRRRDSACGNSSPGIGGFAAPARLRIRSASRTSPRFARSAKYSSVRNAEIFSACGRSKTPMDLSSRSATQPSCRQIVADAARTLSTAVPCATVSRERGLEKQRSHIDRSAMCDSTYGISIKRVAGLSDSRPRRRGHHIERARMSSPLAAVRLSIASDGSSTVDPSVDTSSPLRRHLSWMVSA